MNERFALLLFLILTVSSLIAVKPGHSSITQPSVPEFTVKLVDSSYDVLTSYSIDPFTGENVTHTGYHVESRSIEVKIKNQPFVPYWIQSNPSSANWTVRFYYNIRIKGHYSEDWIELYRASDGYIHQDSDSEYTTRTYVLGENNDTILGTKRIKFPAGAQVDFQVEAMIGYVHRDASISMAPWVFTGEKSGWSETQTLTIIAPDSITTSNMPPSQDSTTSPDQSGSQNNASSSLDWTQFATLTLLGVIAVLLVIVGVYLRRRSTK